ncbi:MAG: hypothetical protein EZS28_017995 [Streblomastix strix]|uniref:Uncharacterized protein n=1 Tax=Streblomastix strix TaxID=222440 RepID=A0A5J4VVK2_9EUKA|nr:MAG: hypothetical protein EZS28_017995 [Streblomastix strix]
MNQRQSQQNEQVLDIDLFDGKQFNRFPLDDPVDKYDYEVYDEVEQEDEDETDECEDEFSDDGDGETVCCGNWLSCIIMLSSGDQRGSITSQFASFELSLIVRVFSHWSEDDYEKIDDCDVEEDEISYFVDSINVFEDEDDDQSDQLFANEVFKDEEELGQLKDQLVNEEVNVACDADDNAQTCGRRSEFKYQSYFTE